MIIMLMCGGAAAGMLQLKKIAEREMENKKLR